MALRLGDTVPDFTQDSQLGPIHLYDFAADSWVVLFSHPADYTPSAPPSSVRWPGSALSGRSATSKPSP